MSKKTYILDTNVLLTDPDSIYSFEDNDVVLPFTTIEELDKIKSRPNEVGANARECARRLSEMIGENAPGTLKHGLRLKNGGTLRLVAVADLNLHNKLSGDWDPSNKDNHILDVCRGLTQEHKDAGLEPPVLITRDILLRVKCDFLGIPCEDYKKMSVADSIGHLYTGSRTVEVSEEAIQKYWETEQDSDTLNVDLSGRGVFPNEFVTLTTSEDNTPEEDRPVLRFNEENKDHKIVRDIKGTIYGINPRNKEQLLAMDLLLDPSVKLITLIGRAGSGKTVISLAAGLNQVLEKKKYKSLFVCRPVVPVGNDIGFLPGDKAEKLEPWIAPIKDNLRYLLFSGKKTRNNEATLQGFFDDGIIEVEAITYLRGRSIANAFIIIDEAQNLTAHELKTIITRVGENTKIILTGDIEQIDNLYTDSVSNGLTVAVEKFKQYGISGHVTLVKGERSFLASLAASIL